MRAWQIWLAGALLVLLVSALALGIARSSRPTTPTGDLALIESYTIQATAGRLLVGPYSRFQWHHPGPIYFYALTPFYLASHQNSAGLNAAALTLNLSMLVLAVVVAGAGGGPVAGTLVAAMLAAYVLRADDLLTSVWNPHVVVLPMVVTALAAAAAASGQAWFLPIAALAASFAAETHAGTLPVAVSLCAIALAALAASSIRRHAPPPWRAFAATGVVVVLAWLPSIIEQVKDSPGNVTALWTFFSAGAGSGQTFHAAFIAWANMLAGIARPDFHLAQSAGLRASHGPAIQAWAIGEMVLLAVVAGTAVRARRRFDLFLPLVLLAASLIALWSVMRIEGEIMDYEILWISAIGALNAAVIVAAIFRSVVPDLLRQGYGGQDGGPGVSVPAVVVCTLLLAGSAAHGLSQLAAIRASSLSTDASAGSIARAASAIRQYLEREGIERPFVDLDQKSWGLAAGVLLQLQRSGVPFAVDDDWVPMFTDAARATGRETVVLSIAGAERHVLLTGQPGVSAVLQQDPVYVDTYGSSANR